MEELTALCAAARKEEVWAEFVAHTRAAIGTVCGRVARRWGARDPALVEELVQETYAKLLAGPTLRGFQPRGPGSALGFVKVVAAGVAHDHFKQRIAQKRGGGAQDLDWEQVEPTLAAAAPSADQALLHAEIEACLASLAGGATVRRDLLIFQMHYRLGMTAGAIASIPALELSPKGVESALARMIRLIRQRLGVPDGENVRSRGAEI